MPLFVTITFLTQPLNWILFSSSCDGVFQLDDAASGTKAKIHRGLGWERHEPSRDAPCTSRGFIILNF